MKRLLTLSLLWGFIFPGVYSDDTGWNYKITTLQAFYFFQQSELLIDGEPIDNEDVIGAFTDAGINVGWVKVGDVIDGAGFITLNTVGNDGSDYASEYLLTGDLPNFRVFDASSGDDSTPTTQNGVLPINVDGDWTDAASGDPADGTFTNLASYMLMGGASAENAFGCTDGSSCNYDSSATSDDGSCVEVLEGCTDSSAFNYDINANTDDGSCVDYIYGCLDTSACNYDSLANTDNGTCEYFEDCAGSISTKVLIILTCSLGYASEYILQISSDLASKNNCKIK